jgi:hydroxymethylbilane synthase
LAARRGDARTLETLATIGDDDTATALAAERAYLAVLDGSCRTPIAGHARLEDGRLILRGQVLREDGSESFEARIAGAPADAAWLGAEAGHDLLGRLPPGVLAVDRAR